MAYSFALAVAEWIVVAAVVMVNSGQPSLQLTRWAVIALMLDGETMKMAQMLERSQTIKRGTGKRQAN